MGWLKRIAIILGILLLLWGAGRIVFAVPDVSDRPRQDALEFDPTTTFGPLAQMAQNQHHGQTGVLALPVPQQALASRLRLADAAERSIDTMYYIWHLDHSGSLLLDALRRAAERGVQVRLLLDDNGIKGMDPLLAALDDMPNFSVRLFNPSTIRQPKALGYMLFPLRMNRRMHNKAFIVDGAAAIVGGRNIGDEYFGLGDQPSYLDLDVLGIGTVVADTQAIFDEYWNSRPVLELDRVVSIKGDLTELDETLADARKHRPVQIGEGASAAEQLADGRAVPEWTQVQVVADDPDKGMGPVSRDQLMIARLNEILAGVNHRLDLISAYFVPGKEGTSFFAELAQQGRDVRILTNSWEATDVPMVHAGYVKYRRELLEAGVRLFELRPEDGESHTKDVLGSVGSSGASLHAKTFSADDARVFIGSFNFDPRSAMLNCEMGYLIESSQIAEAGTISLTDRLVPRSYEPFLEGEDMMWRAPEATGEERIHDHEPGLGFMDRVSVYVLNVLPIEWLL